MSTHLRFPEDQFIGKDGEGFTAAKVPLKTSPPEDAPSYRKKVPIQAVRMDGPFQVETSEGPLMCHDGWLCWDARGYPYPVSADEFELIYEVEEA